MTTNLNTKRAVIYCRVSTKEQAEEGNSLVTQEKTCRDYAQKHGYEIVHIYIEQGESAKTIDRTEFQKLLAFCTSKKNNIQAIIAYKIDRISRNTDDYSQIRMQLKRYNVEIKSTSEYFEDTPAGRFMENIIANVAQFDNEVRTERSVGGMKAAVLEGRYVWKAPLGYTNSKVAGKATIVPNSDRKYIEYIFTAAAITQESLGCIRNEVNKMGIHIQKSQFYKILQNELYAGFITQFGVKVKGSFEPLITESIFNRVQAILKKKRPKKICEVENKDFPLRRFIRNEQGEFATGAWSKGRYQKYPYYYFRRAKVSVQREKLETAFATFLNKFSIAEQHFVWFMKKAEHYLHSNQSRLNESNTGIQEQIASLKQRRGTIAEKVLSGIFTDEVAKEQLQKIEDELFGLENKLLAPKEYKSIPQKLLDTLKQFLSHPGDYWLNMAYEMKLRFQRFNIPQGLIYEKNNCRTTEIPNVFKVILQKFNELSANVNFEIPQNEQAQKPISSPLQNGVNIEELYELHNTLATLAHILCEENEEEAQDINREVLQGG
jgi:site-specific DNA recombinase